MKLKEIITILRNFPMVDQDYVLGSTEDGKYFFGWNWDIEELQTKNTRQERKNKVWPTHRKEQAQDMKEAIRLLGIPSTMRMSRRYSKNSNCDHGLAGLGTLPRECRGRGGIPAPLNLLDR